MKIKILHLTMDSKIAGTEKMLLELAEKSNPRTFDMHFCTLAPTGKLHEELGHKGFRAHSLNFRGMQNIFVVYLRLLKLLKKERFDVVHTHLFLSSVIGLTAARVAGIKFCVITRHYSDYMYLFGNILKIKLDRLCLRIADKVIAVSDAVAKVIHDRDKINISKIVVIHNGIDLDVFLRSDNDSTAVKKELGINNDSFVIGAVGSLHPRKGHSLLINAIPLVIEHNPKAKFVLIGDGPLWEGLKKQIKEMNLDSYVILCGYRSDINRLIAAFDIFIQPSIEEGFGISILEAMASKKAVIASNIGGIPEIVQDNKTGIFIPPANHEKIAEAILWAMRNPQVIKKMGESGYLRVKNTFSINKMIEEYEKVYLSLRKE